jgi:Protein of unknown function (DUF3800)
VAFRICYVDESGGVEDPASGPDATPLMVIAGVIVSHDQVASLTREFLQVKRRFFGGKAPGAGHHLDHVLTEVKGKDIRGFLRGSSRKRHHAIAYLDRIVSMLEHHGCLLAGRVWIKAPGVALNPRNSYTLAIQDIARTAHDFLAQQDELGMMLCDARMQNQNIEVSHSIFTQKHRLAGDPLTRFVEAPAFGHSVNHVGLQLADLVASALVFPMAARAYCATSQAGPHVDPHFERVRKRFAVRIRNLQHRYRDAAGAWQGGLEVRDALAHQSGSVLFNVQAVRQAPAARTPVTP